MDFPFEYYGGGYFRQKGIPEKVKAEILHGQQAIDYLEPQFNKLIEDKKNLRLTLENIINSCVHPESAYRAVLVNLEPIRKVLKETE